jgi:hypothetical protein
VACPFFYPLGPLDTQEWSVPPRLPLGDLQQGECRAQVEAFCPEPEQLLKHCNPGYARGQCCRFPAHAEADAFRFHVAADCGERLEVLYIVEQACWPVRHGKLDIATADAIAAPTEQLDEILRQQAVVFAASYSKRRARHASASS